jgi:predicted kinase
MTRKIAVILDVAGSGKRLVAKHLVEAYGFQRTRFAGSLKNMLKARPASPTNRAMVTLR